MMFWRNNGARSLILSSYFIRPDHAQTIPAGLLLSFTPY
jgi:hypothetical protein